MTRIVYGLVALGLILGTCLGFLGAVHPVFDTIAHFRWHFALVMIVLALAGVAMRVARVPIILIFFAAIGIWQSGAGNRIEIPAGLEAAVDQGMLERKTGGQNVTLLQYNLRFDNTRKDEVLAMILKSDADLLTLNETSRQWMPKLEVLNAKYPHRFHCPEWQAIGGTMLFSKFPLRDDNNYCHAYAALAVTEAYINNQWIEVGVVHMRWPWPASGPEQLVALEPRLRSMGDNAIIAGDFNATSWSHAVGRFASLSGMTVARGFGGTWIYKWFPTSLAPFFGLPIDHVLSKGRSRVSRVKSLPSIGSDHLPLLAEILVQ